MYNRKPYVFKKDTNFSCEVPQDLVEWLAQYARGQYQVSPTKVEIKTVIKEVEVPKKLICDVCGFEAKTEQGLLVHGRKHKKEEK